MPILQTCIAYTFTTTNYLQLCQTAKPTKCISIDTGEFIIVKTTDNNNYRKLTTITHHPTIVYTYTPIYIYISINHHTTNPFHSLSPSYTRPLFPSSLPINPSHILYTIQPVAFLHSLLPIFHPLISFQLTQWYIFKTIAYHTCTINPIHIDTAILYMYHFKHLLSIISFITHHSEYTRYREIVY